MGAPPDSSTSPRSRVSPSPVARLMRNSTDATLAGTHTAMKSGMLAAEAAYTAITALPEDVEYTIDSAPVDISAYQSAFDVSWIAEELKEVRNVRPSFHNPLGNIGGMIYSGIDTLLLKGRVPWTFHHPEEDYAATRPASFVLFLTIALHSILTHLLPAVSSSRSSTQHPTGSSPSTSSPPSPARARTTPTTSPYISACKPPTAPTTSRRTSASTPDCSAEYALRPSTNTSRHPRRRQTQMA